MKNVCIATINLRILHTDIKLATEIKAINNLGFDILPIQKSWHVSKGLLTFEGDSIKGWQLVWTAHKRKHKHGVALVLAPHVKIEDHEEYLADRIHSANINGLKLAILDVYPPTNGIQTETAKSSFYVALNKAKNKTKTNKQTIRWKSKL